MRRQTLAVMMLTLIIIPSFSSYSMELQEPEEMRWGRRIVGGLCAVIGGGMLTYSIMDCVNNGSSLWDRNNVLAAGLLIGGLGSFTTKEYGIAKPVYHPENTPEQDQTIAGIVMSYKKIKPTRIATTAGRPPSLEEIRKNYGGEMAEGIRRAQELEGRLDSLIEKIREKRRERGIIEEDEDESNEEEPIVRVEKKENAEKIDTNIVKVPLKLLDYIFGNKSKAQSANELYYNQQKPILARLPLMGPPINGILYDEESWERYNTYIRRGDNSLALAIKLGVLVPWGAWSGFSKWLKQEKIPEDKNFEQWINGAGRDIQACIAFHNVWAMSRNRLHKNEDDGETWFVPMIGVLPPELIVHINNFLFEKKSVNGISGCIIDTISGKKSINILIPRDKLMTYIIPYIGPWISVDNEGRSLPLSFRPELEQIDDNDDNSDLKTWLNILFYHNKVKLSKH